MANVICLITQNYISPIKVDIEHHIHDLGISKDILKVIKAWTVKEKIDKFNLIKNRQLLPTKYTMKGVKIQARERWRHWNS